MKTENRTVYFCEFCRKYYIHKGHGKRHEKYCKENPANKHKCFEFCRYLKRSVERLEGEYGFCGHETIFTCTKHNKEMYSYIAERRDILGYINYDERMPLNCAEFESMTEEDYNQR